MRLFFRFPSNHNSHQINSNDDQIEYICRCLFSVLRFSVADRKLEWFFDVIPMWLRIYFSIKFNAIRWWWQWDKPSLVRRSVRHVLVMVLSKNFLLIFRKKRWSFEKHKRHMSRTFLHLVSCRHPLQCFTGQVKDKTTNIIITFGKQMVVVKTWNF